MSRPMKKFLVMLQSSFSMKFGSTVSKDTRLWHCATTALCRSPLTTPGWEQQLSLSIYNMLLLDCEWAIISTGALRETSALLTGNIFQLLCTFYSIFQTRVWFWTSWCFADGVLWKPLASLSKLESYGTSCCYKSLLKSCRGLITTIAMLATSIVRMFVLRAGWCVTCWIYCHWSLAPDTMCVCWGCRDGWMLMAAYQQNWERLGRSFPFFLEGSMYQSRGDLFLV